MTRRGAEGTRLPSGESRRRREAVEAVRALLDGELDAGAEATLRQRAAADAELGRYLASLESVRASLQDLEVPGGPRTFVVPAEKPAKSWGWLWMALPMAAAAVVGFAWWSSRIPLEIEAPGIAVELKLVAPAAGQVQVAGDFNGWQPVPLARQGDRWATHLRLPPGRYAYMYVVDGQWTADPEAHSFRDDEFGRQNAVLHL